MYLWKSVSTHKSIENSDNIDYGIMISVVVLVYNVMTAIGAHFLSSCHQTE